MNNHHEFNSKQFQLTDNRRFYIKSAEPGSKSFNVMQRGRRNQFGEPYCVESHMTWNEAVALVEKLNSNTN